MTRRDMWRIRVATEVLNGMLASVLIVDRLKVDKARWTEIAYQWADEVLTQSGAAFFEGEE